MVKPNSRTIRILSQHLNSSKTILRLIKKKDIAVSHEENITQEFTNTRKKNKEEIEKMYDLEFVNHDKDKE